MKKIILGALVILLVVGGYMFLNKKEATTPYTMDEIAKHSSREDC